MENKPERPELNRNAGHRQRLRERFLKAGIDGLQDYEAIELLLTYAIARRDVKPQAKALFERFGSLEGLLDAQAEELEEIPGLGRSSAALLLLIRALCSRYLEQRVRRGDVFRDRQDIVDFLRMKLAGGRRETMAVLYFSSRNKLILYETYPGTVDRAALYPREVAASALRCHASGVIVAHNHPSGICMPSPQDIELTGMLKEALRTINVLLYDHYVVTPTAHVSVLRWK